GTTLAESPPAAKPGVLDLLRRRVAGVNDWAIGRHGPERALIASSATLYVLPFALLLGVLAMVATCAQTLLSLLCLGPLVARPLAAPRPPRAARRPWGCPSMSPSTELVPVGPPHRPRKRPAARRALVRLARSQQARRAALTVLLSAAAAGLIGLSYASADADP